MDRAACSSNRRRSWSTTGRAVTDISIYGQEKVAETIRLCKMNLAVHGLSGDIRQAVTYYEDSHKSVGKFDFVMANPPFNVDKVDKERLKDDPRYPVRIAQDRQRQLPLDSGFLLALNRDRTGRVRHGELCR